MDIPQILIFILVIVVFLCQKMIKGGNIYIPYKYANDKSQYLHVPPKSANRPYASRPHSDTYFAKKAINDILTDIYYKSFAGDYEQILDLYKISSYSIEYANALSNAFEFDVVAKGGFPLNNFLNIINKINEKTGTPRFRASISDIDFTCIVRDKRTRKQITDFTSDNENPENPNNLYSTLYLEWFHYFSSIMKNIYTKHLDNVESAMNDIYRDSESYYKLLTLIIYNSVNRRESPLRRLMSPVIIELLLNSTLVDIQERIDKRLSEKYPDELIDPLISWISSNNIKIDIKLLHSKNITPEDSKEIKKARFIIGQSFMAPSQYHIDNFEKSLDTHGIFLTPNIVTRTDSINVFPLYRWGSLIKIKLVRGTTENILVDYYNLNIIDIVMSTNLVKSNKYDRHYNLENGFRPSRNILKTTKLTNNPLPSIPSLPGTCFKLCDISEYLITDIINILFCQNIILNNAPKVEKRFERLIRDSLLNTILILDDDRVSGISLSEVDIGSTFEIFKSMIIESFNYIPKNDHIRDYRNYKSQIKSNRIDDKFPLLFLMCLGIRRTMIIINALNSDRRFIFPKGDFYEYFEICNKNLLKDSTDIPVSSKLIKSEYPTDKIHEIIIITLDNLEIFIKSKTIDFIRSPSTNPNYTERQQSTIGVKYIPIPDVSPMIYVGNNTYQIQRQKRRL